MGNKEVFDSKGVISWPQVIFELFVKKSGIHFVYIIVILIAILIFMFTYNFAENKDLVAYLSFAATISSLILATFAIFYAVHSNSDISNLSSEIKNSSSVLKESSSNIAASSEKLNNITDEINMAMDGLSQKLDIMPKAISDGFNDIKDSMAKINVTGEIYTPSNLDENSTAPIFNDGGMSRFIKSLAKQPALYAFFCVLSYKSGLKINSDDFHKIFNDEYIGLMSFCAIFNSLDLIENTIQYEGDKEGFQIVMSRIDLEFERLILSGVDSLLKSEMVKNELEQNYVYVTILSCLKIIDKALIPEYCKTIIEVMNKL